MWSPLVDVSLVGPASDTAGPTLTRCRQSLAEAGQRAAARSGQFRYFAVKQVVRLINRFISSCTFLTAQGKVRP